MVTYATLFSNIHPIHSILTGRTMSNIARLHVITGVECPLQHKSYSADLNDLLDRFNDDPTSIAIFVNIHSTKYLHDFGTRTELVEYYVRVRPGLGERSKVFEALDKLIGIRQSQELTRGNRK